MNARVTLTTLALAAGVALSTAALAGGYGYPGPRYHAPLMPGYGPAPMPPHAQMPMGYGYGQPAYGQPAHGQPHVQPAPVAAQSGQDSTADSGQVAISGMQFSPATLTIKAGESVTWQHKDRMPHTVVGEGFGSATMSGGNTFTHTFNAPGEYAYQCSLHPGMKGKIVVL